MDSWAEVIVPGRILFIGEVHGSQEIPAVALAAAQFARDRGYHPHVGLEIDDANHHLDTFVKSSGQPEDTEHLLTAPHWKLRDGRGSSAIFGLVVALRTCCHAFGFDSPVAAARGSSPHARAMARVCAAHIEEAAPEDVFIILAGSSHCRMSPGESLASICASNYPARVMSLLALHLGGLIWAFADGRHGLHHVSATCSHHVPHSVAHAAYVHQIEIDLKRNSAGREGFHGALLVGSLTASAPALESAQHEDQSACTEQGCILCGIL